MLLEFAVKNYKSIKDKTVFSLVAEPSRSKDFNLFEIELPKNDKVRLLKVAAIYGPNASGKTNLLKAINSLRMLVGNPPNQHEEIHEYDPFAFSETCLTSPTYFKLDFIGYESVKCTYEIAFDKKRVLKENLYHYPKGVKKKMYEREQSVSGDDYYSMISVNDNGKSKKVPVYNNQLLLSNFHFEKKGSVLGKIYTYLTSIDFAVTDPIELYRFGNDLLIEKIFNDPTLHKRIDAFLRRSDTGISGSQIEPQKFDTMVTPDVYSGYGTGKKKYQVKFLHDYIESGSIRQVKSLSFKKQSSGTQHAFVLLAQIFMNLDNESGGIVLIDELDTSLHPLLAEQLIKLFQSETTNPNHVQLIFTTHDTNLMDRYRLRKDQVWFTDKGKNLATDLYSLQDFDSVREDTPFEKWYLAGKFKALPQLPSVDAIYAGNDA